MRLFRILQYRIHPILHKTQPAIPLLTFYQMILLMPQIIQIHQINLFYIMLLMRQYIIKFIFKTSSLTLLSIYKNGILHV